MTTRARINEDGHLEVERIINGETYFVAQLCIRKDSYCGLGCPAFNQFDKEIMLKCVTSELDFELVE